MGKDAVKDVEKDCKLVKDEAVLKRVRAIGEKLVGTAISDEVPASYGESTVAKFDYTFKVIDDKAVNAFCLPGGFIYVNSGLLDFVQSDDELAAVLAHEIAHASHHHVRSLMREESKLQSKLALILIAGLIGNVRQTDLGNMMLGTQFYKIAKINGYGQQAEQDADHTALTYLMKSGYNPVGMLTFLERMARHPDVIQWGIFQTHPRADDRINAVRATLDEHHIKIDRRKVVKAAKAEVKQVDVDGKRVCELVIGGKPGVKLTGDAARVESIAESINAHLDTEGLTVRDVRTPDSRAEIVIKGQVLMEVSPEDASLNGSTPVATARVISDNVRRILWQEMVDLIR